MTCRNLVPTLIVAIALAFAADVSAQTVFDHLQCQKIKDPAPKVKYTANLTPEQNDFLAASGCQVKVPAKLFCFDVDKSGVAPVPPLLISGQTTRDFLCYKLKCPKLAQPFPVEDQFGTRTITVKSSGYLCAPARKVGSLDPATPTPCLAPATATPVATSTPAPPSCTDGIKNGGETGIDCGGGMCPPCANGQGCNANMDCVSNICQAGQCVACSPTAETCNGMDDNCNGLIDDGLGSSTCGTGACQVTVQNCVGGVPQTCTPNNPSPETCNGIDDNCDGMVDNNACPVKPNANGNCSGMMCSYTCDAGFTDCNNNITDGCEINTAADNANCGACGNICSGTCVSGQCKFPDGHVCATNSQCLNTNCVDGVCCNTACAGICQACSAAKKGAGTDGTCGNIVSGADPDSECAGTQTCNGAGACMP